MSQAVQMGQMTISCPTRAIVCFGPATPTTGMRGGEFFQVVIDPFFASPSGEYIRFDLQRPNAEGQEVCEMHGWQRIAALTICEALAEVGPKGDESITMNAVIEG